MPESIFWPEACNFIKKGTLAQMFSCEFCKSSKNTSSHRTSLVAASVCDVVLFEKIVNCSKLLAIF